MVESPISNKNLAVEVCWHDQLVFICRPDHPLAKENVIKTEVLADLPFIMREEGSGTLEFIRNHLFESGISLQEYNISMEVGSPEAVKSAVEAGLGISIVSSATVHKEIKLETLVAIPLEPNLERPFSIVHQRQKFRLRAMEEFMEFARDHCEKRSQEDS